MIETSVLLMIFNRPDTTSRVLESIRKVKPPKLYIAADGFRPEKTGEAELCASARQVAIQVDWPCDVITRFRDTNLGPMHAQVDALDWFFSHEEAGII